jgi:hypothetical protein
MMPDGGYSRPSAKAGGRLVFVRGVPGKHFGLASGATENGHGVRVASCPFLKKTPTSLSFAAISALDPKRTICKIAASATLIY